MNIVSINPTTEEINATFSEESDEVIEKKLKLSRDAFEKWSILDIKERLRFLLNFINILQENKEEYAKIIVREVGKTIVSARAEVDKCISLAHYYYENGEAFLSNRNVQLKDLNKKGEIRFEPLGTILGIVSWNFPFWLSIRFIVPAVLAGNTVLLKHSSSTPLCSIAIESLFSKSGYFEGVFQNLIITSKKINKIIADERIQAVNFVGGVEAGSQVASEAGKYIKKTVMELGGSDPFIVLEDADLDKTITNLIQGRLRNAGQACNSPKRVIVHKNITEIFTKKVIEKVSRIKQGDPMNEEIDIGPMANLKTLQEVQDQINKSLSLGADLIYGGQKLDRKGYFLQPAVITNVKPGMPLFDEEVFGPVIVLTSFETIEQAIYLANMSKFGLGASIWTQDISLGVNLIPKINTGSVYINQLVRSELELPFGGVKQSGFGRELGEYGIKEFVNIKSIVISD